MAWITETSWEGLAKPKLVESGLQEYRDSLQEDFTHTHNMVDVAACQDDCSPRWTCRGIQQNFVSAYFNIGLEKYSAGTFWGKDKQKVLDTKCCQNGHWFSPETSLSSQWNYSNSRGFKQTTSLCLPVIELELELEVKVGSFDMFLRSDFLILPFHGCNSFTFNSDWLPYYLNKLLSSMVRQMAGCCCQHSHKEHTFIQHNLIEVKTNTTSSLTALTGLADDPSQLS